MKTFAKYALPLAMLVLFCALVVVASRGCGSHVGARVIFLEEKESRAELPREIRESLLSRRAERLMNERGIKWRRLDDDLEADFVGSEWWPLYQKARRASQGRLPFVCSDGALCRPLPDERELLRELSR